MSDVVALRPTGVSAIQQPDAETIEFLEQLLADARSGMTIGVAIATIGFQGSVGTGWKGNVDRIKMAAAVGLLNYRYFDSWHNSPE